MENGGSKDSKKQEVRIPPQRGQIKLKILQKAAKKIKNVIKLAAGLGRKDQGHHGSSSSTSSHGSTYNSKGHSDTWTRKLMEAAIFRVWKSSVVLTFSFFLFLIIVHNSLFFFSLNYIIDIGELEVINGASQLGVCQF